MKESSVLRPITFAWLLAGTLDIAAAIIQVLINKGSVIKLFQFIASGLIGKSAFSESYGHAVLGFVLHYLIALGWTILFFSIYPLLQRFLKYNAVIAVVYGLVVWTVMNAVVIPLSQITPRPFDPAKAAIAAGILIVAIGLPLTLIARQHYARATRTAKPGNKY